MANKRPGGPATLAPEYHVYGSGEYHCTMTCPNCGTEHTTYGHIVEVPDFRKHELCPDCINYFKATEEYSQYPL